MCPWQDGIFLSSCFLLYKLSGSPWVEWLAYDVSGSREKLFFFLYSLRFDSRSIPVFKHVPYPFPCSLPDATHLCWPLASPSHSPRHGSIQGRCKLSSFQKSSWTEPVKEEGSICLCCPASLRKHEVPLYVWSPVGKQISIVVREKIAAQEYNSSVGWNILILFQTSEFSLSLFQLFSCWQLWFHATHQWVLRFSLLYTTALGLTQLVLMQKSLNVLKPYTK